MSHSLPDSDLEPTPLREGDGAPVSAPAVIPGLREVGGERQRLAASRGDAPMRVLMSSYRSNPNTGGQGVYMRLITKALVDEGPAAYRRALRVTTPVPSARTAACAKG